MRLKEEKLRESGPSRHAKKTKKNLARADKTIAKIKKSKRKEDIIHTTFPAIQLLHDPQGLAERMLRMVKAVRVPTASSVAPLPGLSSLLCAGQAAIRCAVNHDELDRA